jgi:hypothetical protein
MDVLLSTAYLPPICYISECIHPEKILIEAFDTYAKQTCRNHCNIYGPNGKQTLSIPVHRVNGNHTLVKDVRISYSLPWQKIHWKSIETAYNKSPFFLFYRDYLELFFLTKHDFLIDLNTKLLDSIFRILRIDKEVGFTGYFEKQPEDIKDNRHILVSKFSPLPKLFPEYTQVFGTRYGFLPNLSIIDLIFNLGPGALDYLNDFPAIYKD